jgi:hypothetical protein
VLRGEIVVRRVQGQAAAEPEKDRLVCGHVEVVDVAEPGRCCSFSVYAMEFSLQGKRVLVGAFY